MTSKKPMKNKIPVSIHGEYLSEESFINRINSAYQNHYHSRHIKPVYRSWITRGKANFLVKWLYHDFYRVDAFKPFNGLAQWGAKFNHFLNKDAYKYSDDYLQEVLVENLLSTNKGNRCKKKIEISSYRDYLIAATKNHYIPPVDLRWSEGKGWGLFATDNIPPFSFIGLYTGEIRLSIALRIAEKLRSYHNKYKWSLYDIDFLTIDGEKKGQHTRFINHDAQNTERVSTFTLETNDLNPPLDFLQKGLITYKPKKSLQKDSLYCFSKGEEVVWYYGDEYRL